jgi:hypothetical protein
MVSKLLGGHDSQERGKPEPVIFSGKRGMPQHAEAETRQYVVSMFFKGKRLANSGTRPGILRREIV